MNRFVLSFPGFAKCIAICLMLVYATRAHGQWDYQGQDIKFGPGTTNKVAIGTNIDNSVYWARLTVQGQSSIWNLRLANTDPGGTDWMVGSSANSWDAGGGKFVICNSTSSTNSALAITSSRDVGIGTVNPKAKFHVNGDVRSSGLYIGLTDAESVPSGYQLAVVGKAIAQEMVIKLKANWPDYVFEDTYKLPSLLEVERYIRENKHLPEVPSAEEVKEQGLSVGEMNAALLKKVEELTLYMIELKKETETLKTEIAALKAPRRKKR